MKKLVSTFTMVAVMLLAGLSAHAQKNADDITGLWWNAEKTSHIQVFKEGGKYLGKIVHLVEPNDTNGKPKVDKDNPDSKLKNRPLKGLVILSGLEYEGNGVYEDGEIYDPKKGKTYSATITMVNKDQLDLRGYIGISLIGRTSTWTRVK